MATWEGSGNKCQEAAGEIVKVVKQGKGDDLSAIYEIILTTGWILGYRKARMEARRHSEKTVDVVQVRDNGGFDKGVNMKRSEFFWSI